MWVCFSSHGFAEIKRNNANKLPLKFKKKKKVLPLTLTITAPTEILCIGKAGSLYLVIWAGSVSLQAPAASGIQLYNP